MQNQKIRYLLMVGAGGLIGLLSIVRVTYAETIISEGYLRQPTTWTRSGSPYIVEDPVIVPAGVMLTIEPGVSVVGSSLVDGYDMIYVDGTLNINGIVGNRVSISGFGGIGTSGGSYANINYSDISISSGVSVVGGVLRIKDSSISGASVGLLTRSAEVEITNSKFFGNERGIIVQDPNPGGVFPVYDDRESGMGGSLVQSSEQLQNRSSSVTITNSSIIDNLVSSIENYDPVYVHAKQNWWGTLAGPSMFNSNKITGLVDYAPWLEKDPFILEETDCCSSVIFIPGLQGTRLYREEKTVFGSSTNMLWEPNRNADVKKLYLDSNGSSTDSSIYSGDILGKAYGFKDIYSKFTDYLDGLKETKKLNEWIAFGYDWRMPITEVVAGASSTKSLVNLVQDLAKSSKTGKVSIVAHSNGGLVAKYLVKVLTDLNKTELLDSVISVAVPYLGTPEAILGLLHGENRSIAGGFILSKDIARSLGKNMASAYSLLPSKQYFSQVLGPTIAFASTSVQGVNTNKYPKDILSYKDQTDFIIDSKNSRVEPKVSDINVPIEGNGKLVLIADLIHGILDPMSWPSTISKWAIAGLGEKTTKKVVYSDELKCKDGKCSTVPVFDIDQTKMGDGTVIVPSAIYGSNNVAMLDLESVSKEEKRVIAHANILGASSTISTIDKILNKKLKSDQDVLDEISKIPNVKVGIPDFSKEPVTLVLSTHSPVDLHVYDEQGRHVGIGAVPDGLNQEIEDGLITFIDEEIPGVSFDQRPDGFGGNRNYVYLPDGDGQKYTVVINGNGFGDFTYNIERLRGGTILDKVQYKDMPVTPFTVATTTISARVTENAPLPILASSSPQMIIDVDGDGRVDISATSTTIIESTGYLSKSYRTIIARILGQSKHGKDILKKIDKIENKIKKGNIKKVRDLSDKLESRLSHKRFNDLTSADKDKIVKFIEIYISQYD